MQSELNQLDIEENNELRAQAADLSNNEISDADEVDQTTLEDELIDAIINEENDMAALNLLQNNEQELDLSATDIEGNTLLMLAIKYRHDALARYLANADEVDLAAENHSKGNTALSLAAKYGRADIIQILIDSDEVNLDETNNFGDTALIRAAKYGRTDVVQLLVDNNASVDLQNNENDTALHHAAEFGHLEIVRILLASRARVNIANDDGETALVLAERNAAHGENFMTIFNMIRAAQNAVVVPTQLVLPAPTPTVNFVYQGPVANGELKRTRSNTADDDPENISPTLKKLKL